MKENRLIKLSSEMTIGLILIVIMILLTITSDVFLTVNNLSNLLRSTSIYGVLAIGMTFVILSGGIDLSVGATVGLSGMIVAMLMTKGIPIGLSIMMALIAAVLIGVINGVIIHYGKVPPFIATLGTMTMTRGLIMLISGAKMIAGLPDQFVDFASNTFLGLPNLLIVWMIIIIIAWFVLTKTIFGRNIYAIGSNIESARLSGIKINMNTIGIYSVSALLFGIGGIMLTARLGNGIPTSGMGYELDAIAATVVGGTALTGAVGGVIGTVLGSILLATIKNGGVLLGINSFILEIIIGGLIVVSVVIEKIRKK